MRNLLIKFTLIIVLLNIPVKTYCEVYKYILHDKCINTLHDIAEDTIKNENVGVFRDSYGIILRFELKNPEKEYYNLSDETKNNIKDIEYFLAKIKNPAIIEVITEATSQKKINSLKNWEVSTVIANKIEDFLFESTKDIERERIISVGYGEFLPLKNTPNNGGKYLNRVDIIVLCNVSGE